jgi:hypothetical protein
MIKRASPKWRLSKDWGVGVDTYNFILYHKGKKVWKPKGYYPCPELLLKSFYRKLIRTEPADSDLVRHVEANSRRVQECAAALSDQINAVQVENRNNWPAPREVQ